MPAIGLGQRHLAVAGDGCDQLGVAVFVDPPHRTTCSGQPPSVDVWVFGRPGLAGSPDSRPSANDHRLLDVPGGTSGPGVSTSKAAGTKRAPGALRSLRSLHDRNPAGRAHDHNQIASPDFAENI